MVGGKPLRSTVSTAIADLKSNRKALIAVAAIFFPIGLPLIAINKIRKHRRKRKLQRPGAGSAVPFVNSHRIIALGEKLWGGFSQQAVRDLEKVIAEIGKRPTEAKEAIEVLASWHAAFSRWSTTRALLEKVPEKTLSARARILYFEALVRSDNDDLTRPVIDEIAKSISREHRQLAESNLAYFRTSDDALRLDLLNQIFAWSRLEPIALINPSPGLRIDNISCQTAERVFDGPKVSVLMPVYNAEQTLSFAVKSILEQSWQNLEIVMVDDCSTDRSWEIMLSLEQSDRRVRCFRNEVNLGAYPTRNKALSLCTGEYVTVHDADDWSHPQMIELQMAPLRRSGKAKASFSKAARVSERLVYSLRPQRPQLDYIHRSYPSFLARRSDILELGEWDNVTCNADDEFVQRFRAKWGHRSIVDVVPSAPLTFQLAHPQSLTQAQETNLNTMTYGIRREYRRQAEYWKTKHGGKQNYRLQRIDAKQPFPVPTGITPKHWPRNDTYDVVIISDLGLLGGTRRCNEGYINAALEMGWRVGIFNWPYFPFQPKPVADVYMDLSYQPGVDILSPEQRVQCRLLLIHHPPIMAYELDRVPAIDATNTAMLVNQCPMQLKSEQPHLYDMAKVDERCERLFGARPVWVSISPHVQTILMAHGRDSKHHSEIWYPPFNGNLPEACPQKQIDPERIVIGRHSRDHWTKWPSEPRDIMNAFCCGDDNVRVQFLGGAKTALDLLGRQPKNWTIIEFDTVSVSDFLKELDFFVNFVHPDYIEEFGRNVMEAMAAGTVTILSPDFEAVFGEAALYCQPDEVRNLVDKLARNRELYHAQAAKGFDYVRHHCSRTKVQQNLRSLMLP